MNTHDKFSRRAWIGGLAGAPLLLAQDPVIRVDVQLVNITYTVRNKQGGLVGNLTKDDFTVVEDGKPQEISRFQRDTDLPLTIGLLVDISGSMYNVIETGKRAANEFFRKVLREKDLAFVISFGSELDLVQDLTSSKSLLERGLSDLRGQRPTRVMTQGPIPTTARGTRMFDAVYLAADEKLKTEAGRKLIVLLTDGADQGSFYKPADALKQSHLSDAVIYSFFYYEPMYGSDEGALKKLSGDTGGRVFDVTRRGGLDKAFEQLQEEMRSQYSIAYSPTNPKRDGGFRRVEVKTKDGSLKVQARRGYYATEA
ncbi:VWA domain-containing protein [Bryobacter aggregatus]|uniref:VWA domain-containing protein n=1 Tax=Bryobacter aggregatus TaxID=360054 RepID=UPI00068A7C67|nr:VWA domain-containing protein [Bryobacter aggregatus]